MAVLELDVYEPDASTLIGTLTDADLIVCEMRPALFELGAIKITVSRHLAAASSELFQKGNIVKVRIPQIDSDYLTGFVLKDGDFQLISYQEQGGEHLTFTGPGLLHLLSHARLDEEPFAPSNPFRGSRDTPETWHWQDENWGSILTRGLEEGINQPGEPLAMLEPDFDRLLDSDGVSWVQNAVDFKTPIGTDVLTLAERMAVNGDLYLVINPNPDPMVIEAHQTFGRDLTGAFGASTVRFQKGVNILTELNRTTRYDRLTHLITKDANNVYDRHVLPGWSDGDPSKYGFIDVDQTSDPDVVANIAQLTLESSDDSSEEYDLEITPGTVPADGLYLPGFAGTSGHFWLGDWVTVHTGTGEHDLNASSQRVVAIRITLDEAADDADAVKQARSLHIVPELSYREIRQFVGSRSPAAIGNPGFCCGPNQPTPATPGVGNSVLFARTWTYEVDGSLNSTLGDYPWGSVWQAAGTGEAGVGGAFATDYGRSAGASALSPKMPCVEGGEITFVGSIARNWFSETFATKVYKVRFYDDIASPPTSYIHEETVTPGPCSRSAAAPYSFTLIAPPTATYFAISLADNAAQDNVTVTSYDTDGTPGIPGDTTSPVGGGATPGTSPIFAPLDHVHDHPDHQADEVLYDNEFSDLQAVTVQSAIDELVTEFSSGGTIRVPDLLNSEKAASDTPDDDFPGNALDAKWTVVDGASSVLTLLKASGAGQYQVGLRASWLSMLLGTAANDSVELRQDYTLPDGACLVMAATMAWDKAAAPANNETWLGMGVNVNDTGPFSGTAAATAMVMIDTESGANFNGRIIGWDGTAEIGSAPTAGVITGGVVFMRIDRVGLVYHIFHSLDGFSWTYNGSKTFASAADNIWLFGRCVATMANRVIVGVPWIRQGTALALDPWPL